MLKPIILEATEPAALTLPKLNTNQAIAVAAIVVFAVFAGAALFLKYRKKGRK